MGFGVLIDTTKCIGCRSCQVSCKQWNKLPAEKTHLEGRAMGLQNPPSLSENTFTLVATREVEDPKAPGGVRRVFTKRQCMHCLEPSCVSACPVTALRKSPEGPVTYDSTKCMGCRYCVWACPFGVPTAEWDSLAPSIRKCSFCFNRILDKTEYTELNGQPVTPEAKERYTAGASLPACVKACTTGALQFGKREDLLKTAWDRIRSLPERYIQHVYGENEVGGTSYMYLASVPFDVMGFRTNLGTKSYPATSKTALGMVPPMVMGLGGLLTAVYLFHERKSKLTAEASKQVQDKQQAEKE